MCIDKNTQEIFFNLCSEGSKLECQRFWDSISLSAQNELIHFDHCRGFFLSVTHGNTWMADKILHHVEKHTNEQPPEEAALLFLEIDNGLPFKTALSAALSKGYIEVIERIYFEEFLEEEVISIIKQSSEHIQIIWNSGSRGLIFEIFLDACKKGLDEVTHILHLIPKNSHHLLIHFDHFNLGKLATITCLTPFQMAYIYGQVDVLKYFWNLADDCLKQDLIKTFPEGFVSAARINKPEIVKLLSSWMTSKDQLECIQYEDYKAFILAADSGSVKIVRLLWSYLPMQLRPKMLAASNFAAYRLAKRKEHHAVIDFLDKVVTPKLADNMKAAVNQSPFPSLKLNIN